MPPSDNQAQKILMLQGHVSELQRRADAADLKHTSHEDICAVRYKGITDLLEMHTSKLDGINRSAWAVAFSLATTAVGIIGYLLVHLVPGLK